MFGKKRQEQIAKREETREKLQEITYQERVFAEKRAIISAGDKSLVLTGMGFNKIQAIKLISEITGKHTLDISKEIDTLPYTIIKNISEGDALAMKGAFDDINTNFAESTRKRAAELGTGEEQTNQAIQKGLITVEVV